MSDYQEFTGKSVEEALRAAREAFGVTGLDDLDFEILTPGSRGVLGMGAEPARIVAAPRSALGGAAPRREAAAATPLPASEPRPERDRDGGREGRGRDDRGRGGRPDRGPRPDRGAQMDRPVSPAATGPASAAATSMPPALRVERRSGRSSSVRHAPTDRRVATVPIAAHVPTARRAPTGPTGRVPTTGRPA